MEPPKKLITRILKFCLSAAFCAFLLNRAAHWIMDVWQILAVIALLVFTAVLFYRVWKHKRNGGQW